jgi:hypothetical protein
MVAEDALGTEGEAAGPTVTVHRRMEVGDYDVSVLSATGTQVLVDWLNANGYHIPEGHDALVQHYVDKQWYFVALKALGRVAAEKPVMDDVAPIGIRFATEELVYPLYISRGSSRQKTALLLIALTEEPVECEQLKTAGLPLEKEFRPGTCYATIRREALGGRGPAAVCEYAGYGGLNARWLSYKKDVWTEEGTPALDEMCATRLWTLLDREDMVDLTFKRAPERAGSRLVIDRTGRVLRTATAEQGRPWRGAGVSNPLLFIVLAAVLLVVSVLLGRHLGRLPAWSSRIALALGSIVLVSGLPGGWLAAAVLIASVALVIVVLVRLPAAAEPTTPSEREPGDEELRASSVVRWALICAGWVAVGMSLGHGGVADFFTYSLWGLGLELLWIALACTTLADQLRQWGRDQQGIFWAVSLLFLAVVVVLAPLGELLWVGLAMAILSGAPWMIFHAGALLVFAAVFGFAIVGVAQEQATSRHTAQAFSYAVLALGLLMLLSQVRMIPPAHAGAMIARNTGVTQLDSALRSLDEALLAFLGDTGCYPKSLDDLAGPNAPLRGLDSSGNEVRLAGQYRGPYLDALPMDTLTGRTGSWVYEVTGTPMIDSGGYTIRMWLAGTPEKDAVVSPEGRKQRESYWGVGKRYPFDTGPGAFDYFGERPQAGMKRCVMRQRGGALLLADVGAHLGSWFPTSEVSSSAGSRAGGVNVAALSPDGLRVAFAVNQQRTTRLSVCDVHYQHRVAEHGGRVATPGENFRRLTPGPWRVDVLDLAWHPREEKWAVAAQPLEYLPADQPSAPRRPEPRAYIVDGMSAPREVPNSEGCRVIRWAPDAEALFAITGPVPRPGSPRKMTAGRLQRISLAGTRTTLAEEAYVEGFAVNQAGVAVITEGGRRVLYVASSGEQSLLTSPDENLRVEDLWLGEEMLMAAYTPRWDQGHTPKGNGVICVYSPVVSEPRVVAEYRCSSRRGVYIVGYDPDTSAVVVGYDLDLSKRQGSEPYAGLYALRSAAPRSERLVRTGGAEGLEPTTMRWAGKEIRVSREGCFVPSAFRAGDFIAAQPSGTRAYSVQKVAAVDDGELVVGDKRIEMGDEMPVLGETRHYLKFRRVREGG